MTVAPKRSIGECYFIGGIPKDDCLYPSSISTAGAYNAVHHYYRTGNINLYAQKQHLKTDIHTIIHI